VDFIAFVEREGLLRPGLSHPRFRFNLVLGQMSSHISHGGLVERHMKSFAIGLSIVIVTLGTAFADVTNPNAPTGPYNPDPPAQATGLQAPAPCSPAANIASNGTGATPPTASAGQPQATQGDRQQTSAAKDKPLAAAGCAGQDHPAGGSAPAPANPSHP